MRILNLSTFVLAMMAFTSSAVSNPYPDIYFFGDSLLDNGQFDGLRFTNRVGPNYLTSPYGQVAPAYVTEGLNAPFAEPSRDGGTNYAVGGNESDETLASITADTTYLSPYALDRPGQGFDPVFNSLFYDLERNGQSFQKNALYILDGGGNDIGNGRVFDDATAEAVADNMVDAATALRDRGAKYVVLVNVPNFGLAPGGVPFGDFASDMANRVNNFIAEKVGDQNILIFDVYELVQEVVNSPQSFGIPLTSAELSTACFGETTLTCAGGNPDAKINGSNPDPNQFFFNDFLHSTTLGQQITGDYFLSTLTAPGEFALLPQMGMDNLQAQWRATQPIVRVNRWRQGTPTGSYTIWGGGNFNEDDHDTDYGNTGTTETSVYNVGIALRPAENWYMGAQLGRGDNKLEFDRSASRYEMESLSLTLLAGLTSGPWFFEGALTYSDLDYDELRRSFDLGPFTRRIERADTEGETFGFKFTSGLNVANSEASYRFGPTWSFEYIDSEVDSFAEREGFLTALRVSDLDSSASILSAGIFADRTLQICDCDIYGELIYRGYVDNDDVDPRIGQVDIPGNSARLPGYRQDDESIHLDIGMEAELSEALGLNVGGGYKDADNGEAYWLGAELLYTF